MLHSVALVRIVRRHIQEDGILYSHCRENVRSYRHVLCSSFFTKSVSEICGQIIYLAKFRRQVAVAQSV
jgi:hypothetical protein